MPNPHQEIVQKVVMLLRAEADENERRVTDFRQFAEQLQTLANKEPKQNTARK